MQDTCREDDPPRRGGRYDQEDRHNGRRELPGPPPRSGDRDRSALPSAMRHISLKVPALVCHGEYCPRNARASAGHDARRAAFQCSSLWLKPCCRHARQGRDRRSGFGEAPADLPPEEVRPMNGAAPAVEGKLHRSRANRWEPQQDAALPGPPGPPPGPPQREGCLLTQAPHT